MNFSSRKLKTSPEMSHPPAPERLEAAYDKQQDIYADFFAVLDNATCDDTLQLLREYQETEPRLNVVWEPENRTVAGAYFRG